MGVLQRIQMAAPAALVAATTVSAAVPGSAADSIRAIGAFGPDHTSTAAMQRFAELMAETTLGRFEVAVESEVPGGADEVLGLLQDGEATLGWVELEALAPLEPAFGVMRLPFLYQDEEQVFSMLEQSHIEPLLNDQLREQGLVALGYMDGGALRLATTGPLPASLEDLKGQRVVVQGDELRLGAFEALGIEAVAIAGEGALGDADAYELSYRGILSSGLDPGTLQVASTPHTYGVIVVVANMARYDELSIDQEEMIKLKLDEAASWQRGAAERDEAAALEDLERRGMQLGSLPEELPAKAREAVVEFVRGSELEADDAVVEAVLAYAG